MKRDLDTVIVIPVGPKCRIEFIVDTIESIIYYFQTTYQVIISDDSHNPNLSMELMQYFPELIILKTKQNLGKNMGLYRSLSNAYRYALDEFNFKSLLRLDTDALVIGHNPDADAIQLFQSNSAIGLAGRIIRGKISVDEFGTQLNNSNQRGKLIQVGKLFTKYYLKHPVTNWKIRKILFAALHEGYEMGEMVFGGAYFFSRVGLEKLREYNMLPLEGVDKSDFEEDFFFSLLLSSVGLTLGNLAGDGLPFGCTWSGLPAAPETLFHAGKKIIHSTRFWQDMKENEIRQYYKSKRI